MSALGVQRNRDVPIIDAEDLHLGTVRRRAATLRAKRRGGMGLFRIDPQISKTARQRHARNAASEPFFRAREGPRHLSSSGGARGATRRRSTFTVAK